MHNDYLLSLILGIIEGLTEFLPVSSTAHLRLTEQLMQINLQSEYWKMYSVVIQLGAVLCLPVYFWGRIVEFCKSFPQGKDGTKIWLTHPLALTLIAFVVTAGPAFRLDRLIGKNLESMTVIGYSLLIGGLVMWIVDTVCTKPRTLDMEQMNVWQAVWIGAAQILSAVFPGTSRSMSTIAAGQIAGMSRPAALEFSFFVSIPVMFMATLYKLAEPFLKHTTAAIFSDPHGPTGNPWLVLLIGFVVSFLVAWAVVAWFMGWVRHRGFTPFAIYRIIIGVIILVFMADK